MSTLRKIAAKQAFKDHLYFLKLSGGLFLCSLLFIVLSFPKWLCLAPAAIGALFLLSAIKYRFVHTQYLKASEEESEEEESSDALPSRFCSIEVGDVAGGTIRVNDFVGKEEASQCYEEICKSIQSDTNKFAHQFNEFIELNSSRYPDWASEIRKLKIDAIYIYFKGPPFVARVNFKGEAGDFWHADYDSSGFSSIYWS